MAWRGVAWRGVACRGAGCCPLAADHCPLLPVIADTTVSRPRADVEMHSSRVSALRGHLLHRHVRTPVHRHVRTPCTPPCATQSHTAVCGPSRSAECEPDVRDPRWRTFRLRAPMLIRFAVTGVKAAKCFNPGPAHGIRQRELIKRNCLVSRYFRCAPARFLRTG